jgi:hypothetical protein
MRLSGADRVNRGLHIQHTSDDQSIREIATMPVPAALRPLVRLWIGTSEMSIGPCRRRELPGAHVILVFQFGPPIRISRCGDEECTFRHRDGLVAGLFDSFVTTEHDGSDASIQVNLTPLGARSLLRLPLDEITLGVLGVIHEQCERFANSIAGLLDAIQSAVMFSSGASGAQRAP